MKRKLLAYMCLICMLFMLVGANAVKAETTEDVTTEAEIKTDNQFLVQIAYGIDSHVKYNTRLPVRITITNQGKDFTGEVRLYADYDYMTDRAYGKEISIPAGGTKDVSMAMYYDSSANAYAIQILNEKGELVYQRKINQNMLQDDGSSIVGILSDDFASLNYIDGKEVKWVRDASTNDFTYVNLKCAKLDEKNMPDIASALATCNIIVIDNFDTSKLSDEQYEALVSWVNAGGMLILGTGAEYSKVMAKFQKDFISGTAGALEKKTVKFFVGDGLVTQGGDIDYQYEGEEPTESPISTEVFVEYSDKEVTQDESVTVEKTYEDVYTKELDLDVLDLKIEGANHIVGVGEEAFSYLHKGEGTVLFCHFSLGMEPFTSDNDNLDILVNAINEAASDNTHNRLMTGVIYISTNTDFYLSNSNIDSVRDPKTPDPIKFMLLFLVYVVLVGPGLYLILKWKDKRTAMWVAIPITAVVFTGGVYVLGLNDTIHDDMINAIVIEEYGETGKTEQLSFSVTSPKTNDYNVEVGNGYTNVQPPNDHYYGTFFMIGGNNGDSVSVIREKSNSTELLLPASQGFTSHYFTATRSVPTDEKIKADLIVSRDELKGTITNNTGGDLVSVLVGYDGFIYYIERIAAGESVTLDSTMMLKIMEPHSVSSTIYPEGRVSEKKKEWQRLSMVADLMTNPYYESFQNQQAIICAYHEGMDIKVTEDVKDECVAAYVRYFADVRYDEDSEAYVRNIHANYVTDMTSDFDTQMGWLYGATEVEVEYQFFEDNINVLYNCGVTSEDSQEAMCEIWNPQTQSWDAMFLDGTTFDISTYVEGDSRRIRIKYVCNNSSGYGDGQYQVPIIAGGEN